MKWNKRNMVQSTEEMRWEKRRMNTLKMPHGMLHFTPTIAINSNEMPFASTAFGVIHVCHEFLNRIWYFRCRPMFVYSVPPHRGWLGEFFLTFTRPRVRRGNINHLLRTDGVLRVNFKWFDTLRCSCLRKRNVNTQTHTHTVRIGDEGWLQMH